MYGSTTIAHTAIKLAAAVASSVLALPASITSNESGVKQIEPAAIHETVQKKDSPRRLTAAALVPAQTPITPTAPPPSVRNANRFQDYRCETGRTCVQLDDKQKVLVLLAVLKTGR